MWLASVALRDGAGEIVGTAEWTPSMWAYAEMTLRSTVLAGVGDRDRERFFRMCITACLHRGVLAKELRLLPQWWHDAPATHLAGGPLEVLWSKGLPAIPSAEPCAQPIRKPIDARRPDLWLPLDCGACPSCVVRRAIEHGER